MILYGNVSVRKPIGRSKTRSVSTAALQKRIGNAQRRKPMYTRAASNYSDRCIALVIDAYTQVTSELCSSTSSNWPWLMIH
jgi:hypothetical protein